jgi:signal transduction histidine kinase
MAEDSRSTTNAELEAQLRTEREKLALIQDIGRALSSALDLDELLSLIMEKVNLLMDADRSTLYLVSDDGRELWSKVLQGGEVREIRLNVGEGIAGWVAASGETLNIPDAYVDPRFQPAVDLRSGYRTRSSLCVPMRDSLSQVVGVLQVLNKRGGPFAAEDEELLAAMGAQAAVSIENAKLYHSVVAKNIELLAAQEEVEQRSKELNLLFEIEREMNAATDLDELLERLLYRSMGVGRAAAGSIALREGRSGKLRYRTVAGPLAGALRHRTIPAGTGLIGWAVANRQPAIVDQPASDPRHAADFARKVGWVPRHLLVAPLIGDDEVLGAIELIDRVDGDSGEARFTDGDLKLLTLIAGQVSRAIQIARRRTEQEKESRLASIGQMMAGVLHDLKTPMTIISGYAQLMAQMEDAEQREQYVHQILRQFDLMSGMTREVLAFARGESNVLIRKVYLNRFVQEVKTQLEHVLAGKQVALVIDASFTGAAYFDEQSLMRLVHNLARNAAEAMAGQPGTFSIRFADDEERLLMSFSDDGPGIPAELEGRLFELFASAKKGGTGLGLAICKKIVDEHHGTITCESSPSGTTFRVALPKRPFDASLAGESSGESGPHTGPRPALATSAADSPTGSQPG